MYKFGTIRGQNWPNSMTDHKIHDFWAILSTMTFSTQHNHDVGR